MFWNRSTATILQQWQLEMDHSLETGQTSLLQLGESNDLLDSLAGVAALQSVTDRRILSQPPLALMGGNSPAWLLALWQRRAAAETVRSNGVRVVYGGAGTATNIASTTITDSAEVDRLHHWREVRPRALAAEIEPQSQPGSPPSQNSLPLIVMANEWSAAENSLQEWVAWLAVALVVIVLVFSLIT